MSYAHYARGSKSVCNKCGNTGLLPFILPDGATSKHAQVFCSCHPTYGDNRFDSTPLPTQGRRPGSGSKKLPRKIPKGRMHLYTDDLDFPVSFDFYRALCKKYEWPCPDSQYPQEQETPKPQEVVHVIRHSEMSQQESDMLQQLSREVKYLREKLAEKEKKLDNNDVGW